MAKSRHVAARVDPYDYTDIEALITIGIYDSKSDAIRNLLSMGLQHLRDNAEQFSYYCKAVWAFDEDYLAIQKDPLLSEELLDNIEQLGSLFNYEIRYRVGRKSALLSIAQEDIKQRRSSPLS